MLHAIMRINKIILCRIVGKMRLLFLFFLALFFALFMFSRCSFVVFCNDFLSI